jgi:HJR/Mrr/RecB family endonuclease
MSKWPESAVAVALVLLIATVAVTGIVRHPVEEFLKIWAALTGLVGTITGVVVTYFFTRASVDQAQRRVVETERKPEVSENAHGLC